MPPSSHAHPAGPLLVGALLLAGGVAARRLPLTIRSPVEVPRLTVSVHWPGASALLVERELTAPIERVLHRVPGIRTVRSTSQESAASVEATLAPDADPAWVRLGVREQLEQLRPGFPEGASPPDLTQPTSPTAATIPLALVTIDGPRTPRALVQQLETVVAPRLRALPGVSHVTVLGGAGDGLRIAVDPSRLRSVQLSPADVARQVGAAAQIVAMGVDHTERVERPVLLDERPVSRAALEQLALWRRGGPPVPLGLVATVRASDETRGRFDRLNGNPVVGLEVAGQAAVDARVTMARLRRALAQLTSDLPAGIRLQVARDGTAPLDRALHDLRQRAVAGTIGLVLLIGMRWRHRTTLHRVLRSGAGAAGGTVLTLALWQRPVPIDALVLLMLACGPFTMLGWRAAQGEAPSHSRRPPDWWVSAGVPLLVAALALPIGFLDTAVRSLLVPPVVVLLMLAMWLGAGAACGDWPPPRIHRGSHPGSQRRSCRVVRALRHPLGAVVLTALLTMGGFWYAENEAPRERAAADPGQPTSLRVDVRAPRGTELALVDAVLQPFERLARTHAGVAATRASGSGSEAHLLIELAPGAHRTDAPRRLYARLVERATQVGGMEVTVQGNGPAFHAGSEAAPSAYRLTLAGYAWDPLDSLTAAVAARVQHIPRVREVGVSSSAWREALPGRELLVQPDRTALARLALPVGDVAAAVAGAAGGLNDRVQLPIDGIAQVVAIRDADADGRTLETLEQTPLPSARGPSVRLRDVGAVRERLVPERIVRDAQRYVRYVHYEIRGSPRRARLIQDAVQRTLATPPGFSIAARSADADPDAAEPLGRSWRFALLGGLFAALAAALWRECSRAAVAVLLVLPPTLAGALAGRTLVGEPLTPESLGALVLAGTVTARLALATAVEPPGLWWTVAGAAASAVPLLVLAGPETPGRLPAAMALGGIGLGTIAVALTRPVWHEGTQRSAVD